MMIIRQNFAAAAKRAYSLSRLPSMVAGSTTSETSHTFHMMRDQLMHLRLLRSREPIPFTGDLAIIPLNEDEDGKPQHKKVTVVGCGQVGMAIAYAMLNQVTAGTIALIDRDAEKLEGEAKDLQQGSAFHQNVRIDASTEYDVSAHSHLVIITAGVAQTPGESRLNLLERNVKIMRAIIPNVLAHSPQAAICIVSNPCDIMTAVANKIAGPSVPPGRIFGSGTCLDSSRLVSLLAKTLHINGQSVSGYVIGEHGDSSVPVWSSVRIGGVPLLHEGEIPSGLHAAMHREVVDSASDVIQKKGYTNWAVGLTGAYIANAVLDDVRQIMPVSTCIRGLHGIEEDIFLSMPCSIGAVGIQRIVEIPLTDLEVEGLRKSAKVIWDVQKIVWDKI